MMKCCDGILKGVFHKQKTYRLQMRIKVNIFNVMEPSPADSDARAGTATFRYGERYEFIPVHALVASTVFVRKGRMITVVVPAFLSATS